MMISGKNLSLKLSGKIILDNLSFEIQKGEHVCLFGPSGSGKSSILQLLQGYLIPDKGTIHINGLKLDPDNIKEIRSQIAWLPQNVYLPVNNGLQVLDLLNASQHHSSMLSWMEQLGLNADESTKNFDLLSGGQKQRLMLAICLSLDKPIMLWDEPTSALDDGSITQLIQLTQSMHEKTIISTSHHPGWKKNSNQIIRL